MTDEELQARKRVTIAAVIDDIVRGDDGFYVYWPTRNKGAWTEVDLAIIAFYIAKLNEPIEAEYNAQFPTLEYDL